MNENEFLKLVGGAGLKAEHRTWHVPAGTYIAELGKLDQSEGTTFDGRAYLGVRVPFVIKGIDPEVEYIDENKEPVPADSMDKYLERKVEDFIMFFPDDQVATIDNAKDWKARMKDMGLEISEADDMFERLATAEATRFKLVVTLKPFKDDDTRFSNSIKFKQCELAE